MPVLAELPFRWIWLIYKDFAPSGAKNLSTLSKKLDAPRAQFPEYSNLLSARLAINCGIN
jgi:hypothetical protein